MSMLRRRMMMAINSSSGDEENLSDYFHVISHEDQTIAFMFDCQYNFDDGTGWHDLSFDTVLNLPNGAKVYIAAITEPYSQMLLEYANNISLAGNIMSLVYGHDFRGQYSLEGYDYIFIGFACTEIDASAIKSVENLILPATTLSYECYSHMFYECENITKAPVLPASTLVDHCYDGMFYGCTNLNYIKMLATDISATDCLVGWVDGVSSTGTFVKHPDMTSLPTGVNGIPEGWTVVNDGEESGGLISFYIYHPFLDTNELYQAEKGMTWGEWVDSSYNPSGYFYSDGNLIMNDDGFVVCISITDLTGVKPNEVIIENHTYSYC